MDQLTYNFEFFCHEFRTKHARANPDGTAFVCDADRLTWADLDRRTNQFANFLLDQGLEKGEKVGLFMANSTEMMVAYWGVIKAGCVIVAMNPMLDDDSFAKLVEAAGIKLLFVDAPNLDQAQRVRPVLGAPRQDGYYVFGAVATGWSAAVAAVEPYPMSAPAVEILPGDSMTLSYTSGTTGIPKGVEHTHAARLKYPLGFSHGLRIDRNTVMLLATPLFATGTLMMMLPTIYAGGVCVLTKGFDPGRTVELIEREQGTHIFLVPTQWIRVIEEANKRGWTSSSMRVMTNAGQALPTVVRDELEEVFPNGGLYEVYGMTEGFSTVALPEDVARGSVGRPTFMEDFRIIDDEGVECPRGVVGEIVAYGAGMMKGYYRDPELTAGVIWRDERGRTFIRSGDLGYLDDGGSLFLAGRSKEMIKSGGINIFARDLEEVFMRHPEVLEVAAVAAPHPKWIETPVLLAIREPGATVTEDELRAWGNEQLAKYQRVDRVEFRDEFPRALYGKIKRQDLRDEFWDGDGAARPAPVRPGT